jgi:hypothetical protein
MAMDIGGLFKLLNSNICDGFYPYMTLENKQEIIDKMMNDEVFMSMAHQCATDDGVIRSMIDTNIRQRLKKKTRLATPREIFLANLDGISSQLSKSVVAPAVTKEISVVDEIAEFDEEKGKHIGSGIYLKREGHLIKMTTPNFTVHY